LYQATNANLTALATDPTIYQATNTVLTTWAGITPGANVGTFLATPSSANFLSAVTDETGSGGVVASNAPSIYNPTVLGALQGDLDLGDNNLTNVGALTVTDLSVETLTVTNAIDGVTITNVPDIKATNLIVITGLTLPADSIGIDEIEDGDWGDFSIASGSATLDADTVAAAEMADADHGDISWSGGTATLDADVVAAAEMADADHGDVSWSSGVASVESSTTFTLGSGTVTNNIAAITDAPVATNIVDMTFASRTVTLDSALTFLHVTNAIASRDMTHVLSLRAGGTTRVLTPHANWQTNAFSPVPANITNGWLTKIYFNTIGATADAASQTNVLVSFELYKVP